MADPRAFMGSVVLAISGFIMWRRAMRRSSLIDGTATSRIATAAKGYVELAGTARPISGQPLLDPITSRPCLWFKIITEQRHWSEPSKWRRVKDAVSKRPIVLEDPSGSCAIPVSDADMDAVGPEEILKTSWSVRHRMRRLVDGETLYALGHIERIGSGDVGAAACDVAAGLDVQARTSAMLRGWKKDPSQLLTRFDRNQDGMIDAEEWDQARLAAQGAVLGQLAERTVTPGKPASRTGQGGAVFSAGPNLPPIIAYPHITHRLSPPADGRPLLVSNQREAQLARGQHWRSLVGLAMFVIFTLVVVGQLAQCTPR